MTDGGIWITTFLSSLVGSGAVAAATVRFLGHHLADRWLADHKAKLDRELENYRYTLAKQRQRMEAELGHRTYVTKTQFDTELTAIKEVFSVLGKLRLSFNGLRPFIDRTPDKPEDRLRLIAARLQHFAERYNVVVDTAESSYPFIPAEIYEQIETCMKAAQIEINNIQDAGPEALSPKGYEEGRRQHERFSNAYFKAAQLVRERFQNLTIVSQGF